MSHENRDSTTKTDDQRSGQKPKGKELDKALAETFPASDPVTVGNETSDEPVAAPKDRRTPELDTTLVDKLARELKEERGQG